MDAERGNPGLRHRGTFNEIAYQSTVNLILKMFERLALIEIIGDTDPLDIRPEFLFDVSEGATCFWILNGEGQLVDWAGHFQKCPKTGSFQVIFQPGNAFP